MILRLGEVVLIRIDFLQTPGGKLRPAVVLLDAGDDDLVAAPVTSHLRVSPFDHPIQQWREAGLNTPSTIRVHKLTVLAKSEIVRRVGELAKADWEAVHEVLRRAFSLTR
jgi:mRNA interferase MazF